MVRSTMIYSMISDCSKKVGEVHGMGVYAISNGLCLIALTNKVNNIPPNTLMLTKTQVKQMEILLKSD